MNYDTFDIQSFDRFDARGGYGGRSSYDSYIRNAPAPPPPRHTEPQRAETLMVDAILSNPGRVSRPDRIVIIIRGAPGSGKSYLSKLIKVINIHTHNFSILLSS